MIVIGIASGTKLGKYTAVYNVVKLHMKTKLMLFCDVATIATKLIMDAELSMPFRYSKK